MPVSLVQGLLGGGQMQLGGVQLLPGLLQRSHQLLQLLESTHVDTRSAQIIRDVTYPRKRILRHAPMCVSFVLRVAVR